MYKDAKAGQKTLGAKGNPPSATKAAKKAVGKYKRATKAMLNRQAIKTAAVSSAGNTATAKVAKGIYHYYS